MTKEEIEELDKLDKKFSGGFDFYSLDCFVLSEIARYERLRGKKEEHDKVQDALGYLKAMKDNPPSDWAYSLEFLIKNIDNVIEKLQS